MLRKLWRRLRRQKQVSGMKFEGPAGTGRAKTAMTGPGPAGTGETMTLPGVPGGGGLVVPMTEWLPLFWRCVAELAAQGGWKPTVFIDEEGLREIPLPLRGDDAPQE